MRALALSRTARRPLAAFLGMRELVALVTALALLAGAGFSVAWRRIAFIKLGQEIQELEEKEAGLAAKRRQLESEKAMLSTPDRIESYARENLDMIHPRSDQLRVVR